ncbi:cytochrome P450 monooxygenase afumB [Aspergillus undulatus]|uniref:cytochrome P450 monooxygenase afumB n=1 Tax=Aspergillus undulatus TaxID=1810928 RepID=UPI003CCD8B00
MTTTHYVTLASALLYYILFYPVVNYLSRRKALKDLATKHDCKDPVREYPWEVLGIMKVYDTALHIMRGTSLENISRLFAQYGDTYATRILNQRVYITCDPRNIRHILVNRFSDFSSSRPRAHLFAPVAGNGIFTVDGAEWKAARRLYTRVFSNVQRVLDLESHEAAFQALRRHIPAGHVVDLQPLFFNLITDLNTTFATGISTDSLSPHQPPDKKQLFESLNYVKRVITRDALMGPVRHLLSHKGYARACKTLKVFVEGVIRDEIASRSVARQDEAQAQPGEDTHAHTHRQSVVQCILDAESDVVTIQDAVVSILIAGTDSVAGLLSSTFYLLARHERVYAKLRREVLDTVGAQPPRYEMLRKITYLGYVFNEAMRLLPSVPLNARTATRDTWLPVGGGDHRHGRESAVLVRNGEIVIFSPWESHRSTKAFGHDSFEFRPERWDGLKTESLGYVPFGDGPRVCIGQRYAILQASYVAIRMIQTFSSLHNTDARPWTEMFEFNLFNKNGVVVELMPDTQVAADYSE